MIEIENRGRKKISLFSLTALCMTAMIGSGWMFAPLLAAKLAGNYAFLAWGLATIMVLAIAMSYIPIINKYPVQGIASRCVSLSHGSAAGLPFAFANWLCVAIAVPTEAQATGQYLLSALDSASTLSPDKLYIYSKIISTFVLFFYLAANYFGIKLLVRLNNPMTVIKVMTPIFIVVALLVSHFDSANFTLASNSVYSGSSVFSAMVGAGMIYCLSGFQVSINYANEVENPKRNVPLSLIISIVLVAILFLFIQLAFMGAVPQDQLAHGWAGLNFHSPLLQLTVLLGMHISALVLMADSVISPGATGYPSLGGASRMFYAMAQEGQIPKPLVDKLHPVYNISRRAIAFNFGLALAFLWGLGSWETLMGVVSYVLVIGFMAGPITMGVLNKKLRIVGLLIFICVVFLIQTIDHETILLGNGLFSILFVLYAAVHIWGGAKWRGIIIPILPFWVLCWVLLIPHETWLIVIIAVVAYWVFTSKLFRDFCLRHSVERLVDHA